MIKSEKKDATEEAPEIKAQRKNINLAYRKTPYCEVCNIKLSINWDVLGCQNPNCKYKDEASGEIKKEENKGSRRQDDFVPNED